MKLRMAATLFAVVALIAMLLPATVAGAQPAGAGKGGFTADGAYIVQMADQPVVAYEGGIPGYRATAPGKGQKIDPLAPDVVRYVGYLNGKHNAALAAVGGAKKLYDYVYSYNGFPARLTAAQANTSGMTIRPGTWNIRSSVRRLATRTTSSASRKRPTRPPISCTLETSEAVFCSMALFCGLGFLSLAS